jgi:hypothetical protein
MLDLTEVILKRRFLVTEESSFSLIPLGVVFISELVFSPYVK